MKKLNSIKKISKIDPNFLVNDPLILFADFFNGLVIKVAEEYIHES